MTTASTLSFAIDAPEHAARRAQDKASAHEQDQDDLRAVLALPEGRRVLARLLRQAAPLTTSFAVDPLTMAFREGYRNAGLALVAMVSETAPEHLAAVMFSETP